MDNIFTQEFGRRNVKFTFFSLNKKVILEQAGQDSSDMNYMFFNGARVDQDVVYVDNHTLIQEVFEKFMNKWLENWRCIGKPIWHNQVLVVPPDGEKSPLPFIALLDSDEILGRSEVQLGEILGCRQLFKRR